MGTAIPTLNPGTVISPLPSGPQLLQGWVSVIILWHSPIPACNFYLWTLTKGQSLILCDTRPANFIGKNLLYEGIFKIKCSSEDHFLEIFEHSPIQTQAKAHLEINLLIPLHLCQTQVEDLHEVLDSLWTKYST